MKNTIFFLILLVSITNLNATDTRGKDFWLNFLPNYHSGSIERTDSLIVNIIADEVTKCKMEFTDISGIKYDTTLSINNPKETYSFKLHWKNFELRGINYLGNVTSSNQCEKIAKQSFHITSDKSISVVAYSKASLTYEAFLVYPTESLGKEYFIMSYNSDAEKSTGYTIGSSSTPSQFSITASEDSTQIEIIPKVSTNVNGISNQKFILNKGETYLVQSKMIYDTLNLDLTGTKVTSNKPIAVFAGHQRAKITINSGNDQTSRDFIAEQMLPTNLWGKNYIVFPFANIKTITPFGNNIFRILAVEDSTKISFNNKYVLTIHSGEFYEGVLDSLINVTSTKPIMIAQFTKSSSDGNTVNNYNYGDPMMLLLTPNERFSNVKKVNCFQFSERNSFTGITENSIKEQYLTIIAPNEVISNIKIDSNIIKNELFSQISYSNYSLVTIKVTDGIHSIYCNKEIAIYVYGYGNGLSYAYNGGFKTDYIDLDRPISENLIIYPNPISTILHLELSKEPLKNEEIEIYNLLGCRIKSFKVFDKKIELDLKELYSGFYFGKLKFENIFFKFEVLK